VHKDKYSESAVNYAMQSLISDVEKTSGEPWVPLFESQFSDFVGSKYAIAVNSGTSGLHAALLALGISKGDEVISPALTVIMDAFATLYVGATPVFADVDPHTWNMSPESVEALITNKTKAIISVSWFGLQADLKKLRDIANKYGIYLIDDSAETIQTKADQSKDWNLPDIRVYSFESKKHMSTGGEGGMVTTDSEELAIKIRKAGGLGYKHLTAHKGRTSLDSGIFQDPNYERFDSLGLNYRMTPVTAAIGIGQLESLEYNLNLRKKCGKVFSEVVQDIPWLQMQQIHPGLVHSYYSWGVVFDSQNSLSMSWKDFYNQFKSLGGDGFYGNCKNPYREPVLSTFAFNERLPGEVICPIAETLQQKIMAFKTNYTSDIELQRNADTLFSLVQKVNKNERI